MKLPIKLISIITMYMILMPSYATVYDLDFAMANVRNACSGINSKMDHLKLMAGINTGVNAVGTVTGAVALGTGIAKEKVDQDYETLKAKMAKLIANDTNPEVHIIADEEKFNKQIEEFLKSDSDEVADAKTDSAKLKELENKSKTLGNIRTGMLATNTATSIAGAVISSQNKATGSIKEAIDNCRLATDDLKDSMMQARLDGRDTTLAKRIVDACSEYKSVDLSKINKLATGATVTSSIGAVAGGVGTITSAVANTDSTRKDNSASGIAKEKNLNTASNVLSGVSTVTSAVSTVLNGVQIATIKKVVSVSDNCEKELQ